VLLGGLAVGGCEERYSLGTGLGVGVGQAPARVEAPGSTLPAVGVAEPWRELTPLPPGPREFLSPDPATPNLNLSVLRVASKAPPAPRPPARWMRKGLTEMMVRWQRGDQSAARMLAGRLVADPRTRTRDLSGLASLACEVCSLIAIDAMRRRITAARWAWRESRWLLPLAGHGGERVRVAVLTSFLWARTQLETQTARKRLETFLRVFRYLAADPSPWVRAEAVHLLGRLKDRSAHRLLVASTRDRFPVVRLAAVEAIAEAIRLYPGAPSTRRVCALLADPSPAVRAAVLEVLPRTQAPCPVARVVALLGDRYRAQMRFSTDASGAQGPRGRQREVREAAYLALPPAFRVKAGPRVSPDERIRSALQTIGSLQPALVSAPVGDLRPMKPLPARLGGAVPTDLPLVSRRLATVLGAADPALVRGLLRTGPLQQGLARVLVSLPATTLAAFLEACDVPLRGQLLAAVVGLLAHKRAVVRHAALERLAASTLDDRRPAVLARTLWLARKDPHPLVRRRSLALLTRWHRGEAVRVRVLRSLADPHPAVRHLAVSLSLRVAPAVAGKLLTALLGSEVPVVRSELLVLLVRRPTLRPPARLVARYLDDAASDQLLVSLGPRKRVVGGSFGSVRAALVSALERSFGRRHRGEEPIRAKRWQDDLLRLGWNLEKSP
jgi:HEAT repeats